MLTSIVTAAVIAFTPLAPVTAPTVPVDAPAAIVLAATPAATGSVLPGAPAGKTVGPSIGGGQAKVASFWCFIMRICN